jgi:hypothetical protein
MALIAASATGRVPGVTTRWLPRLIPVSPTDTSANRAESTTTVETSPAVTVNRAASPPALSTTSTTVTSTQRAISIPTTTTTSTVSTPTAAVVSGSGSGSNPTGANAGQETEQGYFEPPQDTSVVYTFSASGPTLLAVQWPTSTTLDLAVTCPSGTQQTEGVSSLRLTLADPHGSCQATLSEPTTEDATLTYSMTIGPWNGT